MANRNLRAALKYMKELNYSIIPCRYDKKPYIAWEPYQNKIASEEEIKAWWEKWPDANVGIVTGLISGIVVIDVDTEEGAQNIDKYMPESFSGPICTTPRGGKHLYFKCTESKHRNAARNVPGCDFRGNGGYVLAPPSKNGTGKEYKWMPNQNPIDACLPALPLEYIYTLYSADKPKCPQVSPSVRNCLIEGRRDEDLFTVANALVKGRVSQDFIAEVLEILAKNCEPPFSEKEVNAKIQSALSRSERRIENLSHEVREWVLSSNGSFLSSEVYQCLQVSARQEKKNISHILSRLVDEGVIERTGSRNGQFRKIDKSLVPINLKQAISEPLDISWPLGIERYVFTLPKSIAVVAGAPDAGKTAFLLNFAEMNMDRHKVNYFSSEMGPVEFKVRTDKFDRDDWNFYPYERASNFADVIGPDDINIIDYLEIATDVYRVGDLIRQIFDKLNKGVALIALQKKKGAELGRGAEFSLEKPRLYLSMDSGRIKIVKGKNWAHEQINPNGLELNFKLVQGCKFIVMEDWRKDA